MRKWRGKYKSPLAQVSVPKGGARFVAIDWDCEGTVIAQGNSYHDVDWDVFEYLDDTYGAHNVKIYDRMVKKDRELLARHGF